MIDSAPIEWGSPEQVKFVIGFVKEHKRLDIEMCPLHVDFLLAVLERRAPKLPEGPGDPGFTEMLERIRNEVGVEIFDMQHPHTWFRAVRAAQPPGDG